MNTPSAIKRFTYAEALAAKAAIKKFYKTNPEGIYEELAEYLNSHKVTHPNVSAWSKVNVANFIYNNMRPTRRRKRRASTRATAAPRQTRESDSLELATLILCAKIEKADKERMLSVLFKAGA